MFSIISFCVQVLAAESERPQLRDACPTRADKQ